METPDRIQTEDPSYVRDMHSKALLNTDKGALERHRRKLARVKNSANEFAELRTRQQRTEERLNDIADKLDQLFDLLKR